MRMLSKSGEALPVSPRVYQDLPCVYQSLRASILARVGGHGDSLLFSPIFLDSEVDHGAGLTEHSIESRENYLRDKSGEEDNERGGDSDKT
jgi:hypothetical protein